MRAVARSPPRLRAVVARSPPRLRTVVPSPEVVAPLPKGLPPQMDHHARALCMAPPMPATASAGMELCVVAPLVHATKNRARRRSSPRTRGHRHNPSSSPLLPADVPWGPVSASEPEPQPAGELDEGEPALDGSVAQPTQSTTTSAFDVNSIVAYCDTTVSPRKRQPKIIVKVTHIDHAADPLVCHTIELPGGAQRQVRQHELHLLMFQKYQLTHKPTEVLDPDDPDRVSDEHRSGSKDRFGVGSRGCDHLEGKHAVRLAASHGGLTWEVRFHENFITEVTPTDWLNLSVGKNPEGYDWHHNGQRDLRHATGAVTLMPKRVHQGGGHGNELHQQTESEVDTKAFKQHQRPATNKALAAHLERLWLQTEEGSRLDFCNRLATSPVAVPADHVWFLGKIDGIGEETVKKLTREGYTELDHFRRDDNWKDIVGAAKSRELEARISEIVQNRLPYDDHEYRGSFTTAS
eukprot:COSAG02_NODE_226_length_28168_cov_64.619153_5_plen_464_part_00